LVRFRFHASAFTFQLSSFSFLFGLIADARDAEAEPVELIEAGRYDTESHC
jgi:hypothetical protein